MDDIYKDIEDYNPIQKGKMLNNIKLILVTGLFIRERRLNISFVFITQSCFAVLKTIRLNLTHYFIMEISNNWELEQIAFNHSPDV